MSQLHTTYDDARTACLAAEAALDAAFDRHGLRPEPAGVHKDEPAEVAEARDVFTAASDALQAAAGLIADDIEAAQSANRKAINDALDVWKQAMATALRVEASVAAEAQNAAGPNERPVLTAGQIDQLREMFEAIEAAKNAHDMAKDMFKAGATVEQMGT